PTFTPAIETGEPVLRSPILSNSAVTWYPALAPPSFSPLAGSWVVRNTSAAKPSSTNSPVPISSVRFERMSHPTRPHGLESGLECGRQNVIQQQYEHGRGHHRPCRRQADARSRRLGVVTLVHGNQAADQAEHQALGDPLPHVVEVD